MHARFVSTGVVVCFCSLLSPLARAQTTEPIPMLQPPPLYGGPSLPMNPPPSPGQPPYAPPYYAQPPIPYAGPPDPVYPYRPITSNLVPFRPQFGVGVRVSGLWTVNDLLGYGQGGIGLDLLMRIHPRVTLELSLQYQRNDPAESYDTSYDRTDVPILAGLRVHLGRVGWSVSPYLAAALGADYARAFLPTAMEAAWFAELQGGGGLEGRIGRHFAINVDLRAFGRWRSTQYGLIVTDANGNSVELLSDQLGILFNVSFAVYF